MKPTISVIKFGGITLILAGILFLAEALLVLPVPGPPLADTDLMAWLQDWRFNLSMADEVLFFASLLLIPSIVALYQLLAKENTILTMLGCGLLAVIVPMNMFLVIILGRMVYPVYELALSPDSFKLVVSIYYGGMHCVALILGLAIILLSLVIRRSAIGRFTAYLGLAAGVMQFIGSYPWLIGGTMVFVSQLLFSVWLVILGFRMRGRQQ
ncbi:hypothetical protein KC345_g8685 [Hortaea werneckii]|nr:hypothetical protein KC345_g8685 [Hortaea werneckii]